MESRFGGGEGVWAPSQNTVWVSERSAEQSLRSGSFILAFSIGQKQNPPPSTWLHISVEGAQPEGSFRHFFLSFFFVRYRLGGGWGGARKRDGPVEAERAALPVPHLRKGVRQTADPVQTPVPAYRWALGSSVLRRWLLPKSVNKSY